MEDADVTTIVDPSRVRPATAEADDGTGGASDDGGRSSIAVSDVAHAADVRWWSPQREGETREEQHHGHRSRHEPPGLGVEQQRDHDDDNRPTDDARPSPRRRVVGGQDQPQPGVQHEADAPGEGEQDEADADPQDVDPEPPGEEPGDAAEDPVLVDGNVSGRGRGLRWRRCRLRVARARRSGLRGSWI